MSLRCILSAAAAAVAVAVTTAVPTAVPAIAADSGCMVCDAPADLIFVSAPLPRVGRVLTAKEPLKVLVYGSGTTIGKFDVPALAFPGQLGQCLRGRMPLPAITVDTDAESDRTTAEMLGDLDRAVFAHLPDLVIWETGTTDAVQGIDPTSFGEKLAEGVDAMQARGIDVILMDGQYGPLSGTVLDLRPFSQQMYWVAQSRAVNLFYRHELMSRWAEGGLFDPSEAPGSQALGARFVHGCIGSLLASLIEDAARSAAESTRGSLATVVLDVLQLD